jgi:hypothetical protein
MTPESPSGHTSPKAKSAAERMRAYRHPCRRGLRYVRSHARGRRLERTGRQADAQQSPTPSLNSVFLPW